MENESSKQASSQRMAGTGAPPHDWQLLRLAMASGGIVGLLYGAIEVARTIVAMQAMLFDQIIPHLPSVATVLLGYGAAHALALTVWTGILAGVCRWRGRRLTRDGWLRTGLGVFVGLVAWMAALNLMRVCVEVEVRAALTACRAGQALSNAYLVLWAFAVGAGVSWIAVRSFAVVARALGDLLAPFAAPIVRRSLALAAGLAAVLLIGLALWRPAMARWAAWRYRYNVLLITVDTLRPDYLSCYDPAKVKTEHIDALARGGVVFENAVSQSPWTRPSVATILTGRYPSVHQAGFATVSDGKIQLPMYGVRRSVPFLAEMLANRHLTTQAFVTNAHIRAGFGFDRGFDDFSHFDKGVGSRQRQESKQRWGRRVLLNGLVKLVRLHPLLDVKDMATPQPLALAPHTEGIRGLGEHVVARTADWLTGFASSSRGRFFLWLHLLDPHEYSSYHAIPEASNGDSSGDSAQSPRPFTVHVIPDEERDRSVPAEQLERAYRDNILYTDWILGLLFDQMKRLGIYDQTLIILTADHGEEFMEHGALRHAHSLYDEVIRVPLILSLPGVLPAGKRVERQARLVDVVPTVLDVLGVRPPPDLDGKSLLALLTPGAEEGERDAFSEFMLFGSEEQKSLRTSRFKIIYTFESRRIKLFDLQDDPQERENVAKDQVAVAARLLKRLDEWVKETRRAAGEVERPGDTVIVSQEKEIIERLKALGYIAE